VLLEIGSFVIIVTVIALLASYALVAPRSQWLGKTLVSGDPQLPAVCLTFDDGPGESTPLILDALKRHGIRATFFLLGENVVRLPEVVCRIAEEGHEIGNHSYSHPYLCWKGPGTILWEVRRTQEVIGAVTGRRPTLFRPPYGVRWFGLSSILDMLGLTPVMWSVSSVDWRFPAPRIVNRVVRKTRNGSIILLHDGVPDKEGGDRRATAEALDELIQTLAKRYRFVTASEMLP